MAVFTNDDYQRLDYLILRDGPIALYSNDEDLEQARLWFQRENYQIYQFEKEETTEDFYRNFYEKTSQGEPPNYYGYNLDAWRDYLYMLPISQKAGIVFIFYSYDELAKKSSKFAYAVLDILAEISRYHLMFGSRFLVLIYSHDASLSFQPVGASPVLPARWKPLPDFD